MDDPDTTIRVPTRLRAELNQLCADESVKRGTKVTQAEMLGNLIKLWRKSQ